MKPNKRHSTITVTGADGIVHSGAGVTLAQAVRDLAAEHDRLTGELQGIARTPGSCYEDARTTCAALSENEREADRYRLTAAGWRAAYQLKGSA